jgi:hypothetical protein
VPLNRPPRDLNVELLNEKCSDFAKFQIWPLRARLDARGWLANFESDDLPLARHLLNAFIYFSDDLTRQLFVSALQGISVLPTWRARHPGGVFQEWARFTKSLTLTYVTGEVPNPADSGHLFARKARDHAGIPEGRIVSPEEALRKIVIEGDASPIVFVDDFVGSGNQFCDTWERQYQIGTKRVSFQETAVRALTEGAPLEVYYAAAVCTQYGCNAIEATCSKVAVSAGNVLDERYSVFHPESLVWPAGLVSDGQALVRRISIGLGLPDDDSEWGLLGFHALGLAVGFAHKIPDATIPLFRYRDQRWRPLVMDV